jgi:hypothetical protein
MSCYDTYKLSKKYCYYFNGDLKKVIPNKKGKINLRLKYDRYIYTHKYFFGKSTFF